MQTCETRSRAESIDGSSRNNNCRGARQLESQLERERESRFEHMFDASAQTGKGEGKVWDGGRCRGAAESEVKERKAGRTRMQHNATAAGAATREHKACENRERRAREAGWRASANLPAALAVVKRACRATDTDTRECGPAGRVASRAH